MRKERKFIVKIKEGMANGTHYVSMSYDGCSWGGTMSLTDNELKAVADKIYEYLGSKN